MNGAESFTPRAAVDLDDDVIMAPPGIVGVTLDERLASLKTSWALADYQRQAAELTRLRSIPAALRSLRQWVLWAFVDNGPGKKPGKVPLTCRGTLASSTKSETWATFDDVVAAFHKGVRSPDGVAAGGVGFVFTVDAGVVGVDLDGCRDPQTGEIAPWARDDVATLASWSEVSPTGTGLHVFVRGALPDGKGRQAGQRETYAAGRFFAMTGHHVEGTPADVVDNAAGVARIVARIDAAKAAEKAATKAAKPTTKTAPTTGSRIVDTYLAPDAADAREDFHALLAEVANAPPSTRNNTLNACAFSVGRIVAAGFVSEGEARDRLCAAVAPWGTLAKDAACIDRAFVSARASRNGPWSPTRRRADAEDVDAVDWQAFTADNANTDRDEGEDVEDEATRQWREDVARALADVRTHATKTTAAALVARGAIPFQSLAELEASDLPKTRWLVSGLVTERAVAVISGEPKTAKTWVAQEIAVAVATGGRVFGEFKTGEPKPAALFLVEDGASNTRARLRGILDGHAEVAAATRAAAAKRLSVRCLDSLDLTDELHLARFVASVRRLPEPPAVVVLDPLRDLHTGAEDKSDDMAKVSAALRTLRNVLDAAVVFVHHAGKTTEASKTRRGGQRMRGSSALHGAVDAGLHMYEPQNAVDEATRTTTMRASIESEVKAGRSAGTFGMTLAIVDGEPASDDDRGECQRATFTFSRQRAAERAKDDAAERDEDAVLAALKARHDERPDDPEPFTKRTLIAAVGGQTARIGAAIERLTRAGGVSCVDGPNRSLLLTYSPAKAAAFLAKRNPDPFGGADVTED